MDTTGAKKAKKVDPLTWDLNQFERAILIDGLNANYKRTMEWAQDGTLEPLLREKGERAQTKFQFLDETLPEERVSQACQSYRLFVGYRD